MKKLVGNALEDEADRKFFGFIPVQVGPASQYARRVQKWMQAILVIQFAVCLVRFVALHDFAGCFWLVLICAVGWYAWSQDMNITYICVWGLACFFGFVFDTAALVLPLLLDMVTMSWLMIPLRALVPACELLGAAFAWHLYHDYYTTGGGAAGGADSEAARAIGELPDPMAKIVEGGDPASYGAAMFAGFKARGVEAQGKLAKGGESLQAKGADMQGKLAKGAESLQQQAAHGAGGFGQKASEGFAAARERAEGLRQQAAHGAEGLQQQQQQSEAEHSPFSTHPAQNRVRKQAPCC